MHTCRRIMLQVFFRASKPANVALSVWAVSRDRSRLTRAIARIEWISIAIAAVAADRLLALPSVGEVTIRSAARHVVKAAPRINR